MCVSMAIIMKWLHIIELFLCLFMGLYGNSLADRISQKVYVDLKGNAACFRRLNATHQTGCTSKRSGSVGVLHLVHKLDDLRLVLENGSFSPYVIGLPYKYFNSAVLHQIQDSGKASGVLILLSNDTTVSNEYGFSPDQNCPNANYGMYRGKDAAKECQVDWNPTAQNVLFEDWNFPIFFVNEQDDIKNLMDCYRNFNSPESLKAHKWPLCAVELRSYMLAAKDTKTCIRRSHLHSLINMVIVCDPLGDQSIWMPLNPMNKSTSKTNGDLIVVAARLDATSVFDGVSPGADTTVTGLVTLLAVAEALAKLESHKNYQNNVLFILFNGESFDYIGSSRIVYEMENNNFPSPLDETVVNQSALINLKSISHFIELNQLYYGNKSEEVFIHYDVGTTSDPSVKSKIDKMIDQMMQQGKRTKLVFQRSAANTLPSASLQIFLRKNRNISGIVVTDHDTNYTNRFYNSIFDTTDVLTKTWNETEDVFVHLAKVSSAVAGTVHFLAGGVSQHIPVNSSFVRDLVACYANRSLCPLFMDSSDPASLPNIKDEIPSLYVSVNTYINRLTHLTVRLLAYLTGERLPNVKKADCHSQKEDQMFLYFWMRGSPNRNESGLCVKTMANLTKATSPAFDIEDYDFDSGEYSTWTESVWEQSSVRIFLKPSEKWEITVLMVGIVIFAVSFMCVWCIDRNSNLLFVNSQVVL